MKRSDKKRLAAVASIGCVACMIHGNYGTPAEVHHKRAGQGLKRASHDETMPLCPIHHRHGDGKPHPSIHGTPKLFVETFGTEDELIDFTNSIIDKLGLLEG